MDEMQKCRCGCGQDVPKGQHFYVDPETGEKCKPRRKNETGEWPGVQPADTSKAKEGHSFVDKAAQAIPGPRKFDPNSDLRAPLGRTDDSPRGRIRNLLRLPQSVIPRMADGRPIGYYYGTRDEEVLLMGDGYVKAKREDFRCDEMPVDAHPQGHNFSGSEPVTQGELSLYWIHPDLQAEYQNAGHLKQVEIMNQIDHPEEFGAPKTKEFFSEMGSDRPAPTAVIKQRKERLVTAEDEGD